jgi:hypothetical protein
MENEKLINPKVFQSAEKMALSELKSMIPVFIIGNISVISFCIIYQLITTSSINWRLFTGFLAGNAVSVFNFYMIGVNAGKAIRTRDSGKARTFSTFNYFSRYAMTFIVFAALMYFNLVNVVTAFFPLFFPRIHYLIRAIFYKKV